MSFSSSGAAPFILSYLWFQKSAALRNSQEFKKTECSVCMRKSADGEACSKKIFVQSRGKSALLRVILRNWSKMWWKTDAFGIEFYCCEIYV